MTDSAIYDNEAFDPAYYLEERYADLERRTALSFYYAVKPMLPRRLQLAVRRVYSRRQTKREFPRWPRETILVEHQHAQFLAALARSGRKRLAFVNFWPRRSRFSFILTHDVESRDGLKNIEKIRELERRYGLVSSWNFVADWYPISSTIFDELRSDGCEIGLHGIKHDGKLFDTRATFSSYLPLIHDYAQRWGVAGFRSPSTRRKADWMPELGCLYDSSFPDTDPFEPQSGGCCSIFPYFLKELVELPITLVQDHTLFEILGETSSRLWVDKARWIASNHGFVNVIVHPDYMSSPARLGVYEELLSYLAEADGGWHGLPRDVAQWWVARSCLGCEQRGDSAFITGDAGEWEPTVAWARASGDGVAFDT